MFAPIIIATRSVLLLGFEDGGLALWDARAPGGAAGALTARADKAHTQRIRAIVPVSRDAGAALPRHVATASSDGAVKVWDCRRLSGGGSGGGGWKELASVETRGRITCMALSAPGRRAPVLAGAGAPAATAAAAAAEAPEQQKHQQRPQKQQQAAKQQQQQQQQQQPKKKDKAGKGAPAAGPQQQQPQPQQPQPHLPQRRAGAGAGADEALVPRIQTIIRKKKKKAPPRGADDDGGGFGSDDAEAEEYLSRGVGGAAPRGVTIVNRKAKRPGRH